jgi:hypothetical protein
MTEVPLPEPAIKWVTPPSNLQRILAGKAPFPTDGAYTPDQLREYARQAVLMERERCAKVCEEIDRADTTCRGDLPDLSEFAAAIRRG